MRKARFLVLISCLLIFTSRCADNRESLVKEHLQAQVGSQSSGALSLLSLKKTNAYDQERDGLKLYVLEWEAELRVENGGWKAGWSDFALLQTRPNAIEAAIMGGASKRLAKGGTVVLLGKSTLQRAERGWRVVDAAATASRLIPPPSRESEFLGSWKGYWVSYGQDNKEVVDNSPTFDIEIRKADERFTVASVMVGSPPGTEENTFTAQLTEDAEMVGIERDEDYYKLSKPTIRIVGGGQLRLTQGEGDVILKRR